MKLGESAVRRWLTQFEAEQSGHSGISIRPVEFLRCIFDVAILEVGNDALGGLLQCGHEVVGCLT